MKAEYVEKQKEYEAKKARAKALQLRLTCTICGAKPKTLLNCPCGTTQYCSTDCQRIDWRDRGHRKACKKIRDERAAEAARAEAPTPPPSPPREVVYGPAPRSHADEVRARIAAEHEAARERREANPEREPVSARYGRCCPICREDWDVNADKVFLSCCCRILCGSCHGKTRRFDECPLCRAPQQRCVAEVLASIRRNVEDEVPEAIAHLGQAYRDGMYGLVKSSKKARKLYKRAVELGNVSAMLNLGAYYETGDGVKRDWKKAEQLYRMAANRGDADAQRNLGLLACNKGQIDKAITHFELALEQGLESAAHSLEIAKASPRPPTDVTLRFDIGDMVECHVGGDLTWAPGEVVCLWYREDDFPEDVFAPYQIELEDGNFIYARDDTFQYIRPRARFAVGTAVECCMDDEENEEGSWTPGKVMALWILHTMPGEPERVVSPYRVELDSGGRVYAHYDDDDTIRLLRPP